jgi:hypothetical protein
MHRSCRLLTFAILVPALASTGYARDAVVIASGSQQNRPRQPQIVVDEKGAIHVAFGINNTVLYCRSDDAGQSFGKPVELPGTFVMSLGMRRGPRIAVTENGICVSAIGGKQGKGKDGDLLAYHSADHGKSWHGPLAVNDAPDVAREGLHAMAGGPQGQMCCVWLDLRNRKTEIYAAVSGDGGQTWGKNILVYHSPDGSVCECCHPSVAFDAAGKLHVMWRNSLSGSRDMYLASSADGGNTFGKAVKLGKGTWPLDACPMDGGQLAISPKGDIFTAWRRDSEVFFTSTSGSSEQRIGVGKQPWIAAAKGGPHVLWLQDRTGQLMYLAPGARAAKQLAPKANDPVIAAAPGGSGPTVAAWEQRQGNETELMCQVVAN